MFGNITSAHEADRRRHIGKLCKDTSQHVDLCMPGLCLVIITGCLLRADKQTKVPYVTKETMLRNVSHAMLQEI